MLNGLFCLGVYLFFLRPFFVWRSDEVLDEPIGAAWAATRSRVHVHVSGDTLEKTNK